MKRKLLLLFFYILLINQLLAINEKTGLVLSGGGVKGLAHIGTLKVIDSLNINIDYIAGTSIGSIAAALYASGYSADEIERICYSTNWDEIFTKNRKRNHLFYFQKKIDENYQLSFNVDNYKPTAPLGLTDGQYSYEYLANLFNVYETIDNFDDMVIPFRCNAVDILSGEEVVFNSGSLSKGIRASTSIPSIFAPIEYDEYLLIDGGVKNNLPTNIVKSMGANKIIAVDVMSERKSKKEINSILDVVSSTLNIYFLDNNMKNKKDADILINPKLKNINVINFNLETMNQINMLGNQTAYKNINLFLNLPKDAIYKKLSAIDNNFTISHLNYNDNFDFNDKYILKTFKPIINQTTNKNKFLDLIQEIRQTKRYYNLSYKFKKRQDDNYDLYLSAVQIKPKLINDVIIYGNEKLTKKELYQIFNFEKNDTINLKKIENTISEAYYLDYFKHIFYELDDIDENYSNIIITIKENNFKKLHLGIGWDNYYKLIGKINVDLINKPTSNFRIQNELLVSGFKRNTFTVYYLGNHKNILRFMPYIENINSINTFEYLQSENNLIFKSPIKNDFVKTSIGLIIPFKSYGFLNINLTKELNNYSDLEQKHKLTYNDVKLNIDQLDKLSIPKNGYQILWSNINIIENNSDYLFSKQLFKFDYYKTFINKHTFRTYSLLRKINGESPLHHTAYFGGNNWTIGYNEFDFFANELAIIGVEYHYHYKNSTTFKLILSKIPKADFTVQNNINKNLPITYGIGCTIKSILGPINITWAKGPLNPYDINPKMENVFYFNFGVNY